MKTAARILVGISLVILVLGCNLVDRDLVLEQGDPPDSDTGAVTVVINRSLSSPKTLTPDMEISTYDIEGTLEGGGQTFVDSVSANERFSQGGLTPGVWTITAEAKNAEGIVIGQGGTNVDITGGYNTLVHIQILPLSGQGGLDLTVQWPKKDYDTASIDASITHVVTGASTTLNFDIKPNNPKEGTSTTTGIAAGYYLLMIHMYGDEQFVWGTAEAVRIVAGAITVHVFDLN